MLFYKFLIFSSRVEGFLRRVIWHIAMIWLWASIWCKTHGFLVGFR